ncbi:MAG: divergent polysaccharide deacetylase family protein [Magnetococcales bacterium]|nr:divergent polysaccharide deacetylase family protein [Magnetococcales bacterium]
MEDSPEKQPKNRLVVLGLALVFFVLILVLVLADRGKESQPPAQTKGLDQSAALPTAAPSSPEEGAVGSAEPPIVVDIPSSTIQEGLVGRESLDSLKQSIAIVGREDIPPSDGDEPGSDAEGREGLPGPKGDTDEVVLSVAKKMRGIPSQTGSLLKEHTPPGSAEPIEEEKRASSPKISDQPQRITAKPEEGGEQNLSKEKGPDSLSTDPTTHPPSTQLDEEEDGENEQSAASDGGIVYEEHFVEQSAEESISTPAQLAPKRTFRPKNTLRLALIIDDLGYNASVSRAISRLPADITLAVLPGGQASHDVVRIAKKTGKELILHQPMQPQGYPGVNPGPRALLASMGPEKIRRILTDNLMEFPSVVGINNHMGSFLTTQPAAMDPVMAVLAERKLFFVDSRTSVNTVAEERAKVHGLPTARREVFIDNKQDKDMILKQLYHLEEVAHVGVAVGIGHPYPETLAALREWLPTLKEKGIILARVSQLLLPESARSLYPNYAPPPSP